MPSNAKQPRPAPSKVMKVNLWLRVENDNKYIRGKKKARDAQMCREPFLTRLELTLRPHGRPKEQHNGS
jgi:hypothetical protein